MFKKKNKKSTRDNPNLLDPSTRSFIYDEVDDFNDFGGEKPPGDDPQIFLHGDDDGDDDEHVLGLGDESNSDLSDEDDDDDSDLMNDDDDEDIHSDEGESEGEDERGLGKRKKDFFGTDLTDQRIHKATKLRNKSKEDESLQLEEESVRRLQERMAKQSIGLAISDLIPNDEENEKLQNKEMSSSGQKSKLQKKKSSEVVSALVKDYKELAEELTTILIPLIGAKKRGELPPQSEAAEYLQTRYFLCLNYLNVVSAYMMVKSSGGDTSQHPVSTRLEQFRHLFKELAPCKEKYHSELLGLVSDLKSGKLRRKSTGRKMLSIVKENEKKQKTKDDKKKQKKKKSVQFADVNEMEIDGGRTASDGEASSDDDGSMRQDESELTGDFTGAGTDDRRLITYQMSKNKGLLPYRKKEQRNPRVKYKNKYKTKLKRRKGQVREVRRETKRYEGEASGININAVKSRRFK